MQIGQDPTQEACSSRFGSLSPRHRSRLSLSAETLRALSGSIAVAAEKLLCLHPTKVQIYEAVRDLLVVQYIPSSLMPAPVDGIIPRTPPHSFIHSLFGQLSFTPSLVVLLAIVQINESLRRLWSVSRSLPPLFSPLQPGIPQSI